MGMEILVGNLNTLGFYDFFLPFILFVAIIFGLLQKNKVFGEKDTKAIDGIVAMSVSFFVINYTPIGLYFSMLFAIGASIIGAILVGVILLGMLGIDMGKFFNSGEGGKLDNKYAGPAIAGVLLVIIALFLYASGLYDKFIKGYVPSIGEDTIVTVVAILFVIVVFVVITGAGKKAPTP